MPRLARRLKGHWGPAWLAARRAAVPLHMEVVLQSSLICVLLAGSRMPTWRSQRLLPTYDPDGSGYALLTIPAGPLTGEGADARDFAAGILSLLDQLPKGSRLLIGCHRRAFEKVAAWVKGRSPPATLVPLEDDLDLSFWGQDACLIAEERSIGTVFLVPQNARRPEDKAAMRAIAEAAGFPVREMQVSVEAGNILVGDDFALVGADTLEPLPDPSAAARGMGEVDALGQITGDRELIAVGVSQPVPQRCVRLHRNDDRWWIEECFAGTGRRQPVFHLDMFISLAGRGPDGRFRLAVGDARLDETLPADPTVARPVDTLAERLDEVAEHLRRDDRFEVIRNHLPLVYSEEAGLLNWSIHSVEREFRNVDGGDGVLRQMRKHSIRRVGVRRWYFATQNNTITYRDADGVRTALLPTYAHGRWKSLAPTERRNAQIWTELGYRVVELGDFNVFARRLGSARCLAKLFC
jgi:hypothetical protein